MNKYDFNQISEICKTALTFTEVEARLGISSPSRYMRQYIKKNNIEMPLYEGRGLAYSSKRISEADLCKNSKTGTGNIKKYLIRNNIKELKCEQCGWSEMRLSDGAIPVHLHHINGDSSDNTLCNLQILCPNCHSLTDNYAGKNNISSRRQKATADRKLYFAEPKFTCVNCGKLGYNKKYCSHKCSSENSRRLIWPSKEQLEEELKILTWVDLGKKYNVSDNAVRRWARAYELLS